LAGANNPNHSSITMSLKPASANVDTSGNALVRAAPVTASTRASPDLCRAMASLPNGLK
jgi:hypothetical protein